MRRYRRKRDAAPPPVTARVTARDMLQGMLRLRARPKRLDSLELQLGHMVPDAPCRYCTLSAVAVYVAVLPYPTNCIVPVTVCLLEVAAIVQMKPTTAQWWLLARLLVERRRERGALNKAPAVAESQSAVRDVGHHSARNVPIPAARAARTWAAHVKQPAARPAAL